MTENQSNTNPQDRIPQERDPLIDSITAAHQERRRKLGELEQRLLTEMPTSEMKARLDTVLQQHRLFTQVMTNAFEEFLLACLEMALSGEVDKAPGWRHQIEDDFDPVSHMRVRHLRAIGDDRTLREHIERIVQGEADN